MVSSRLVQILVWNHGELYSVLGEDSSRVLGRLLVWNLTVCVGRFSVILWQTAVVLRGADSVGILVISVWRGCFRVCLSGSIVISGVVCSWILVKSVRIRWRLESTRVRNCWESIRVLVQVFIDYITIEGESSDI